MQGFGNTRAGHSSIPIVSETLAAPETQKVASKWKDIDDFYAEDETKRVKAANETEENEESDEEEGEEESGSEEEEDGDEDEDEEEEEESGEEDESETDNLVKP